MTEGVGGMKRAHEWWPWQGNPSLNASTQGWVVAGSWLSISHIKKKKKWMYAPAPPTVPPVTMAEYPWNKMWTLVSRVVVMAVNTEQMCHQVWQISSRCPATSAKGMGMVTGTQTWAPTRTPIYLSHLPTWVCVPVSFTNSTVVYFFFGWGDNWGWKQLWHSSRGRSAWRWHFDRTHHNGITCEHT